MLPASNTFRRRRQVGLGLPGADLRFEVPR